MNQIIKYSSKKIIWSYAQAVRNSENEKFTWTSSQRSKNEEVQCVGRQFCSARGGVEAVGLLQSLALVRGEASACALLFNFEAGSYYMALTGLELAM